MEKKTTVLMILDGFGINERIEGNAIQQAHTPVLDHLMATYPYVKGYASGRAVGLPRSVALYGRSRHRRRFGGK